jgi:GNAT superfamily N-acetyltransferase
VRVDLSPVIEPATMVTPMRIRRATLEDQDALLRMGQRFIAETCYRDIIVGDPAALRRLVAQLVEGAASALFVSETAEGILSGMIGLFIFSHHISGQPTAVEVFWWTEPEHRGHGLALLREAERWAKGMGAVAIQMIAPTDEIGRLYERLHYRKVETAYARAL